MSEAIITNRPDQELQADTIAGLVALILTRSETSSRYLVGVAGPPGSGKSTCAEAIAQALRKHGASACVVAMDGFHFDNHVLDHLGLGARKGSPETFDCAGFEVLLKRLRACEDHVAIPIFDRSLELARAGAEIINARTKFLIVEGNYLLLNYAPWNRLRALFDMTVFLDVPIEELDRRLVARWDFYGRAKANARSWIDSNDMPNIRHVIEHSVGADVRVKLG